MALPNLKEIILTAALGGNPQPDAQMRAQPLSEAVGYEFYPSKPSETPSVLLSYQQRVEQFKAFLLDGSEKGANHKAAVLENLVWRQEDKKGYIWNDHIRAEGWALRGRILNVAYGKNEDDEALTLIVKKALDLKITEDDVNADIDAIHEARRRMEERQQSRYNLPCAEPNPQPMQRFCCPH